MHKLQPSIDMKSSTLFRISSRSFLSRRHPSKPFTTIRKSSTSSPLLDLESSLRRELTSRPANVIHDYLSPTPSHLLNITLADFLPNSCHPSQFDKTTLHLPGRYDEHLMPQGHHLVYFPPQVLSSDLISDGTDPIQSPGPPFNRRMWAGGSLLFNSERSYGLDLDGTRAVCIEKVTDVTVKGKKGAEKVFVGVERRVGHIGRRLADRLHDGYDEEWAQKMEERVAELQRVGGGEGIGELDGLGVVERRNLVFLREKSGEEARADAGRLGKVVKPAHEPDFSVVLTPTQQMLFRFSALSFNAHGIHLDPQYCREVEGYRNLLVHGPLSLVLMLSVLRSQLQPGEMVMKFDYRNLAPLFAKEEMKICVRKDRERDDGFDVWIEGQEGGYAVKGSAVVGHTDAPRHDQV